MSAGLPIATEAERRALAARLEGHRLGLGYAAEPSRGHAAAAIEACAFLHANRGLVDLRAASAEDIRAYYRACAERGPLARESLRRQLRRTAALFELLHADGALAADPASAVVVEDYLPAASATARLVPTEAEVARLYEAADELPDERRPARARALLALAYGCGLRAGELAACTVADVRLGERVVVVPAGKGGKRRVVPMGPGVARDLECYLFGGERRALLAAARDGGAAARAAVLVNEHGNPMKGYTANPILRELAGVAGVDVPITCHVLRHAIATHLLQRGATTEHLRRFLGHAQLDTTRHYVHVTSEHLATVTADGPRLDDELAPAALALELVTAKTEDDE